MSPTNVRPAAARDKDMEFQVDVLLRGEITATTHVVREVASEPEAWTEADVADVLKEMLRAVDRQKNPSAGDRDVYLRGVSWIVDAAEDGGVVIAIEIPTGAAVAGPFAVSQRDLTAMIARVMERPAEAGSRLVH